MPQAGRLECSGLVQHRHWLSQRHGSGLPSLDQCCPDSVAAYQTKAGCSKMVAKRSELPWYGCMLVYVLICMERGHCCIHITISLGMWAWIGLDVGFCLDRKHHRYALLNKNVKSNFIIVSFHLHTVLYSMVMDKMCNVVDSSQYCSVLLYCRSGSLIRTLCLCLGWSCPQASSSLDKWYVLLHHHIFRLLLSIYFIFIYTILLFSNFEH